MKTNNRIDSLFGPAGTFAGYVMLVVGVLYSFKSLTAMVLVVAGLFMGFTYCGTVIDFTGLRVRSYTALFGLFRIGRWYPVTAFDKFRIYKSNRTNTVYSRGNIPLTTKSSDIRLELINKDKVNKITLNKYQSFQEARNEMSILIIDLNMTGLQEWAG